MIKASPVPLLRVAALAAALTLVTSAGAFALSAGHGPHGHHGPYDPADRLEQGVGRLELDQARKDAIYAILDDARVERREIRDRLEKAHEGLRTLLRDDVPDQAAVLAQADLVGSLTTELRKQGLSTMLAVRSQLTTEEREQLKADFRGRRDGRGCDKR